MSSALSQNDSYYRLLDGVCPEGLLHEYMKYPYELSDFQLHACNSIYQGENVLVTAKTGSGKTQPAEYAVMHAIKQGKIAVFLSPIKSLSNEKYKDFKAKFESEEFKQQTGLEISVGILTGDNKINPEGNCLIMTTEILRNAQFKLKRPQSKSKTHLEIDKDIMENIGVVIIDEVHFINDKGRGHVYEEILVLLDMKIQLVLLSATIDKAAQFARWLGNIKKVRMNLIPTFKRAVPLRHFFHVDDELYEVMNGRNEYNPEKYQEALTAYRKMKAAREKKHKSPVDYNMIINTIKFLQKKDMLQAIFFAFSKRKCEEYALLVTMTLVNPAERAEIERTFNSYMHKYESQYKEITQYTVVKSLLSRGVAYHHSGLLPILKEIIEIILSKGLIKVLFATETFAVGINVSIRTVVFTDPEKYTEDGKRFLNTGEYMQMAGRAGRRGIDVIGYSLLLPLYNFIEESQLKMLLLGKVPHIESKFKINYQLLLKVVQSQAVTMGDFASNSLFSEEQDKKIKQQNQDLVELKKSMDVIDMSDISEEEMLKIKEAYQLTDKYDQSSSQSFGIQISMSKQSQKQAQKLRSEINGSEDLKVKYGKYEKYNNLLKLHDNTKQSIAISETQIGDTCDMLIQFMKISGYISEDEDGNPKSIQETKLDHITQRGVIAAQINECNPILLTEMIIRGYFDDLQPEEIVSLLAIFINDVNQDDRIGLNNVMGTPMIFDRIEKINKIIKESISLEESLSIRSDSDYWEISYDFVDAAYSWTALLPTQEVFKYMPNNMHEGTFIKNMIKLNNMVHDIACLCEMIGKVNILPALEKIDGLIMRDFVTVNSLYLNNN
jgi:antiviral helicase SKI2